MKRRFVKLAAFLLLGAIINVAVAWGCVRYSLSNDPQFGTMVNVTGGEASAELNTLGLRDVGFLKDARNGLLSMELAIGFGVCEIWAFEKLWPPEDGERTIHFTRAGWPCVDLEAEEQSQDARLDAAYSKGCPSAAQDRQFPRKPIWPGFAINTVFYAAMIRGLWLLFAAPGFVRRRIRARRGQCPACAYPVGQSPICTECGNAVRVRSP